MTSSPSPALSGPELPGLRAYCRELYEADTERAHRFRYGLLAFDVATIVFIVATSFVPDWPGVKILDVAIGLVVLVDFSARLYGS